MSSNLDSAITGIVKPMERGQITIPIGIRKKLDITSNTWLWVKLVKNTIMIEPVESDSGSKSLSSFLLTFANDPKVYWKKSDALALEEVREKSKERLKRLI
ncbi:hypothetical protein ISS42_00585 [Candidatus Shapirobacteria bacterium]|nr:hypothetical protein [Candidatus Shapirobacteria bacterium]